MKHSLTLFAVLLILAGCDAGVKVDPEGYRCDIGNVCPTGYACDATGVCHRSGVVDPSCANVTCNSPPAATCANGTTARTFTGRCVSGACQYDPVDMTCATSCDQGTCVDACQGVSCVTPPAPACTDANTLRTFAQTDACSGGSCSYTPTDTACPNGCSMGRCMGVDLCMQGNVMCNMPPAATCNGNSRRTFGTGTCDPGTGMCTYAFADMVCPNGCAQGMCLTPSLMFAQTGPRVRFAINALDVAPSSSGNSALAVGNAGKLARWDGSMWTELPTNTTATLNSVSFVTGSVAFAAGERTTLLNVRPNTNTVTPVSLSGGGNVNLIAVSGRSEAEVFVAGDEGSWWRARAGTWGQGSLPGANGPYTITAAYLDESLRERVVGTCGTLDDQCVGYRFPSGGTPNWTVQTRIGTNGFSAVGGGFDIPTSTSTSVAFVGVDLTLLAHDTIGFTSGTFFTTQSPSPSLVGGGIVGISAQSALLNRDVYVLTSSVGAATGHLFRLTRSIGITSSDALTTYYGEEHLSPNDANGVLVAEVRRTPGVNNIFRRGPITNEALDVGEDLIGASADGTGALYFASAFGDVIVRRPNATTFEFRRPTGEWSIDGLEARNGTGLLLVGEDANTTDGLIIRLVGTTFSTLTTLSGAQFKSVCRVSDTEGWAVGTRGTVFRINGTTATAVSTPSTNDLNSVDCAAGVAIACGANGTVLRWNGTTWSAVTPAFPGTGTIKTCKLTPNGGLVGGDGFFGAYAMNGWAMLPAKAGLSDLVLRGAGEIYGAYSTANGSSDVARFDGAAWSPSLLTVKGQLGTGVLVGGRVVWGGSLGSIVESR